MKFCPRETTDTPVKPRVTYRLPRTPLKPAGQFRSAWNEPVLPPRRRTLDPDPDFRHDRSDPTVCRFTSQIPRSVYPHLLWHTKTHVDHTTPYKPPEESRHVASMTGCVTREQNLYHANDTGTPIPTLSGLVGPVSPLSRSTLIERH